uniref:Uncharacterized protein n=1 Tax=Rhizophora mucronata TaxID=61149 RepID=A0A2P2PT54_RHIMU
MLLTCILLLLQLASISFVFFLVTLRQMDFCLLFVSQLRMGWLTRRTSLLVCYVLHSRGVSVEHQSFDG